MSIDNVVVDAIRTANQRTKDAQTRADELAEVLTLICQRASEPRSTTAGAVPVCTVPWALIERAISILRKPA